MHPRSVIAIAVTVAVLPGCRGCGPGDSAAGQQAAPAPDARVLQRRGPPPPVKLPARMNATHLLVSYKGAFRAPPWVKRTREQAQARARKLMAAVIKAPASLEGLVRKESDAPRSAEGGYLGNWRQGRMVRAFELAVADLKPGEMTGPVETSFGFHIIRRERLLPEQELSAAHILVAYKGALRAPARVTRSRQEAAALASDLLARLAKEPDDFASLLTRHSDGPRAERGGGLGLWRSGKGTRPPIIERALLGLKPGATVAAPVQTPFGFHLLRRLKIDRAALLSGGHILVAYKGAERCPARVTRRRAAARKQARELHDKLTVNPGDFENLARRSSDDPTAKINGDLGTWPPGQFHPKFEAALKKLKPGEISGVVETPFGFHVIRRSP